MLLGEPPRTSFDLRFSLAGVPVRVHPFFWLLSVILGAGAAQDGWLLLTWVGVVFFSILLHEFGHILAMRWLGRDGHVVLYAMGGLAIEGQQSSIYDRPWGGGPRQGARSTREQVIISAGGPLAGFLFAAVLAGAIYLAGGAITVQGSAPPLLVPVLPVAIADNAHLWSLLYFLLFVNVFWGLLNLLPVFPLDGGQIAQALLAAADPWDGMRKALILSIAVAGGMAAVGLLIMNSLWIALLFGLLAFSNYQALQQSGGGFGGGRPW